MLPFKRKKIIEQRDALYIFAFVRLIAMMVKKFKAPESRSTRAVRWF